MLISHFHNDTYNHAHEHDHDDNVDAHRTPAGGKKDLLIALSITVFMMIVEVIGGLLSNSLALLSDAGHMLIDNFALLLSFFAMKFSAMPATNKKTFGFYRLEILAALINGVTLVLISLYIIYEAYFRIMHPQPVHGTLMLVIAVIGFVANIMGAAVLMKHRHANLNIHGAFLHIMGDAAVSVGVIIGGIVIINTGWYLIDPILSILISCVIIYGSWQLLRESVNILLESAPAHININTVAEEIAKISGVKEAYHIHLWTITSGVYALSAHVLIDDQPLSGSRELINEIRSLLSREFNVIHSTIQLECERCGPGTVCSLPYDIQQSQ
jgi:cobalt-zinc-cadmium efflux system protein